MGKKIQLTIPAPCHENWEAMTPVEKGRFCAACQKQVMDFSRMNDRQVAEFFKKPSTGSVCGRFMQDQLQRDMEIPVKRIPWVKYFFQFAIPAFFVSAKAKAQGEVRVSTIINKEVKKDSMTKGQVLAKSCAVKITGDTVIMEKPAEPGIVISGRITNENNEPVPHASVVIKGTRIGVVADAAGFFKLQPSPGWKTVTLVTSSIGFMAKEFLVIKSDYKGSLEIKMDQILLQQETMGVIVVTKKKKHKKEEPVPLMKDPSAVVPINTFKLFPNPITSGGNLNIEWKQQEEGYYNLEILSLAGQAIKQQTIWIDKEARLLSIDIPLANPGTYIIRLSNKKTGKAYSEKMIIQ
jgi:hypothetical protein